MNYDDIVTYCDIYECRNCPRYGDDCDGKGEDDALTNITYKIAKNA